jgi:hypothetical protein
MLQEVRSASARLSMAQVDRLKCQQLQRICGRTFPPTSSEELSKTVYRRTRTTTTTRTRTRTRTRTSLNHGLRIRKRELIPIRKPSSNFLKRLAAIKRLPSIKAHTSIRGLRSIEEPISIKARTSKSGRISIEEPISIRAGRFSNAYIRPRGNLRRLR